ncbi:MAG: hypothetical protein JOZ24_11660 [Candidatus Eremiobacteraeota bacterium]|nr:hypothetical protein [Candidatus Eremiobacteraeota bacterium]
MHSIGRINPRLVAVAAGVAASALTASALAAHPARPAHVSLGLHRAHAVHAHRLAATADNAQIRVHEAEAALADPARAAQVKAAVGAAEAALAERRRAAGAVDSAAQQELTNRLASPAH